MEQINIHAAKTQLSRLIVRVRNGEEIVIARAGKPVARLVPLAAVPRRVPGSGSRELTIGDNFDDPLPPEILRAFE